MAIQRTINAETLVDPFSDALADVCPADTLSPAERYQELFVAVQTQRIFADSKTFVDCAPRQYPEHILQAYRAEHHAPDFDLAAFVDAHFSVFSFAERDFDADRSASLCAHIDRLWPVLTRHPCEHPQRSSLLPLPFDYVVPGGRFTELYYWDSYFTMLGLDASGQCELMRHMADNFAYLIDTYGHVPNGSRTYYLSRSQPPVFALMTDLFEECGVRRASDYLPQLRKEHAFWMDGADHLPAGETHRRCVRLPCGSVLNRYWDDRDTPRDEAYLEDVETAHACARPPHHVYRDLRAGCESGWDFSSRWLDDPQQLSSIRTTRILPVDLNSFLYKLERQIARLSAIRDDPQSAEAFDALADARRVAIDRYLWSAEAGTYLDYDWQRASPRTALTAAMLTPLFVGLASPAQADGVATAVSEHLLMPGGLATTTVDVSAQQWDKPNGWAPLQWIAIRGLQHYGHEQLAEEIEQRWLSIVAERFEQGSKLVEKYVLQAGAEPADGGEYPLQDGFGWTNGVTRQLLREDPKHQANHCRAGTCSVHEQRLDVQPSGT